MTGIDTNILVRFITADDPAQYRAVVRLLSTAGDRYFLSDLVLIETHWVLSSTYGWEKAAIASAFSHLLSLESLDFEDPARVRHAIEVSMDGSDFADELIVRSCRDHGVTRFATFDKGIIRRHKPFAHRPA